MKPTRNVPRRPNANKLSFLGFFRGNLFALAPLTNRGRGSLPVSVTAENLEKCYGISKKRGWRINSSTRLGALRGPLRISYREHPFRKSRHGWRGRLRLSCHHASHRLR